MFDITDALDNPLEIGDVVFVTFSFLGNIKSGIAKIMLIDVDDLVHRPAKIEISINHEWVFQNECLKLAPLMAGENYRPEMG